MSSSSFASRATRALTAAWVLFAAAPPAASALTVDDDRAQCPSARYRTISGALDAAAVDDTVVVCPGIYRETLQIAKRGVRVLGLTGRAADVVIRAPSSVATSMVDVSGPETRLEAVTVLALGKTKPVGEVDGFPIAPPGFVGVFIHNGIAPVSDAVVLDNVTVRGVGAVGYGVQIGDPNDPRGRRGRAIIRNSRVVDVGNGIDVLAGSVGTIRDNVIRSIKEPFRGAEFGIDVSGTVEVLRNDISGFRGVQIEGCCFSHGIFFAGTGRVGGLAAGSGNNIHENAIGVRVFARGALVSNNDIHHNSFTGMQVSAEAATVSNNTVHENQFGISADGRSAGNRFLHNVATLHEFQDCEDFSIGTGTAGTANTWIGNIGAITRPAGICLPPVSGSAPASDIRG